MHLYSPALFVLSLLATTAVAAAQTPATVQAYLGLNQTQQKIFVRRQADAQAALVQECAPDADTSVLREYFNGWLTDRPQFLNRSTQLAFTRSLTDRCLADATQD